MLEKLKDRFSFIFDSRLNVIVSIFILFSSILVVRLFVLQIIKGSYYLNNYNLKIAKTQTVEATRGNIYDRNGNLLAYNELAYAVTITDSGNYDGVSKNEAINSELSDIITRIERNGDTVDNNFNIYLDSSNNFQFSVSGTSLQRFRADVFGHSSINDLETENKYGINEKEASADEIMEYLEGEHRYDISDSYSKRLRYEIAIVRYGMSQNSYQKYISTVIASDVSDKTVAYILENQNELTGVAIEEKSIRKYVDGYAFASILGYVGTISTDEYNVLHEEDDTVELTDTIGKAGIEQYMNTYLAGTKGSETLFVDSMGNPIETTDHTDPVTGNDVYLSIDKDLQVNAYNLLEQEIAGILYSKIVNTKEYHASSNSSASDVVIPIYNVYFALVENGVIDVDAIYKDNATDMEKRVASQYDSCKRNVLSNLRSQLLSKNPTVYKDLPSEYQNYSTYIVKMLKSSGIFDSDAIDTTTEEYQRWSSEEMSVNEYLTFAIEQDWIDITSFTISEKYVDTNEIYENLVEHILNALDSDREFRKLIYKYAILNDQITGSELCTLLYDQGFLEYDETERNALSNGASAFNFLKTKIQNLEIKPSDLALDPCSGSTVVIDSKTGEVLACVSYPGFDNNKLANSVDSSYYASLTFNESNPLYNHATQQRTAPGSTFKPVTSTAGLAENIISTTTTILDQGIFMKVSNTPKCWFYPSNHGLINVSQALRDSCNYFFYEVGWDLAGGANYDDAKGIELIQKYASMYGLNEKTGIEIEETVPQIATEYPVMAAIGQSDNNFTTIALARYATAISNSGTVYDLTLLDRVEDSEGNILESYNPEVKSNVNVLNVSEWTAIKSGMRMVVESLSTFNGFSVDVAGKTGTAQQVRTRPNHALFIGFAPYNNPRIAIATRIPYGYTSHNAADVSKYIIGCYFNDEESVAIATHKGANSVSPSSNSFTD